MGTFTLGADIGGTKTLLALADAGKCMVFERRYNSQDFIAFDEVLRQFLRETRQGGWEGAIEAAALGVAGPVVGGRCQLTYLPWVMDESALSVAFAIPVVRLVNDFAAAASGIARLQPEQLCTLQAGSPDNSAPRVALGAGTGLGVALLFPDGERTRVVPGEGGHIGFAPRDEEQVALWRALCADLGRVTTEHVVSGPGLARIYRHFTGQTLDPAAISAAALAGTDAQAQRAVALFLSCYGAFAGDLGLSCLAKGGVYLCGGIAPKLHALFAESDFLSAFQAKGCHAQLAASLPVYLVTEERLGLLGALNIAAELAA